MTIPHQGGATRSFSQFAVRKKGRIEFAAVVDLLFAQGADNYVELNLRDGRRELLDCTLRHLTTLLSPDFARIHRSYLVRLAMVKRLHIRAGGRYEAELTCGKRLPVGRTYYRFLQHRLCSQ